jgi:hypothetical protein
LDKEDVYTLDFMLEIFHKNIFWREEISDYENDTGFVESDLRLIQHLYGTLVTRFRILFRGEKHEKPKYRDIEFLRTIHYLMDPFSMFGLDVDKSSISMFDYEENSVSKVLGNYHTHSGEFIKYIENFIVDCRNKLDAISRKQTISHRQKISCNQTIDGLSDLLESLKKPI